MVHADIVKQAFSEMSLGDTHNSSTLSVVELEVLVSKIFSLAHHQIAALNPNESVGVAVSWLLKCLDR